jgi:hypothetical protein
LFVVIYTENYFFWPHDVGIYSLLWFSCFVGPLPKAVQSRSPLQEPCGEAVLSYSATEKMLDAAR